MQRHFSLLVASALMFLSFNSIAGLQLVCKGNPPDAPHTAVNVDCSNRKAFIDKLEAAWRALRQNAIGGSLEDMCWKAFTEARGLHPSISFETVSDAFLARCNMGLAYLEVPAAPAQAKPVAPPRPSAVTAQPVVPQPPSSAPTSRINELWIGTWRSSKERVVITENRFGDCTWGPRRGKTCGARYEGTTTKAELVQIFRGAINNLETTDYRTGVKVIDRLSNDTFRRIVLDDGRSSQETESIEFWFYDQGKIFRFGYGEGSTWITQYNKAPDTDAAPAANDRLFKKVDENFATLMDTSPALQKEVNAYSRQASSQFGQKPRKVGKHQVTDLIEYAQLRDGKGLLIIMPVLGPGFDNDVRLYTLLPSRAEFSEEGSTRVTAQKGEISFYTEGSKVFVKDPGGITQISKK